MYAGEVVVELPDSHGEYGKAYPGWKTAVYEYRFGHGLKMMENVTAIDIHIKANDLITADITTEDFTDDDAEPFKRTTSTWIVVGVQHG